MAELVLHARPVETVFDLLGHDKNDITAALAWSLTRSASLLRRFVGHVVGDAVVTEPVTVELQRHEVADGGFTDIEVRAPDLHLMVEAKRGWAPPSRGQLRRYEALFAATASSPRIRDIARPSASMEHEMRCR
jgi:hypothetical protein